MRLRSLFSTVVLAALLAAAVAATASAAAVVPTQMNYQGFLTDASNNARTGTFKMTLTIWSDSTSGASLWTETYTGVPVANGIFSVALGMANALPPAVFAGGRLWLETAVNDTTLAPRRAIVSVPYSFHAGAADTAKVAQALAAGEIAGSVSVGCSGSVAGCLVYIPGRSFVCYTASNGTFDLSNVPPGLYTVHIEQPGGSSVNVASVVVTAGALTNVGIVALSATNLQTDVNNCGACGVVCPSYTHANSACNFGVCGIASCSTGYANCDNMTPNGCEVNLQADTNNCGACGVVCPSYTHANSACNSGVCGIASCSTGYANCDNMTPNGCEVNLQTDTNNCGACGNMCASYAHANSACNSGVCGIASCSAGYANCDGITPNGCEVNTQTDSNNCGTCGHACASGHTCSAGVCI